MRLVSVGSFQMFPGSLIQINRHRTQVNFKATKGSYKNLQNLHMYMHSSNAATFSLKANLISNTLYYMLHRRSLRSCYNMFACAQSMTLVSKLLMHREPGQPQPVSSTFSGYNI